METTMQTNERWGTRPISLVEAEAVASRLAVSAQDRTSVARTLYEFQPDGMVRGMFFQGMRANLTKSLGEGRAVGLEREHQIGDRFVAFSAYPHRDFYRLWYCAIPEAYPGKSIAYGVERIAETFFPVFLSSAAGRTMAVLIGSDPETILKRLREAYAVSVLHNEHSLEMLGSTRARWTAVAEPSPFYAEALIGILRGAFELRGQRMPKVEWTRVGSVGRHHQKIVFELDWG